MDRVSNLKIFVKVRIFTLKSEIVIWAGTIH